MHSERAPRLQVEVDCLSFKDDEDNNPISARKPKPMVSARNNDNKISMLSAIDKNNSKAGSYSNTDSM